jgi:hypothetical protein
LIIAGVCLLALALLSAGFAAYTAFGMKLPGGAGPMGALPSNGSGDGQFTPPQGEFKPGEGQTPPQGEFTPGEGQTPPEGNFGRDDLNGQRPDGSSFPGGMTGRRGFGLSRWLSLGGYALTLLGAVAAAIGIFRAKKWGVILGIIVAAGLLVSGVFSLFRTFGWLSVLIPILKILLAVAVIVLLVLPGARNAWATHEAADEEDDDDEIDDDDDEEDIAAMEAGTESGGPGQVDPIEPMIEIEPAQTEETSSSTASTGVPQE